MSTIKYTFAKDEAGLTKIINSAVTSAKTMRNKVQIAAVAVIKYAHITGDYRAFNTLVDGLGNGVNTKALVEYIVVHTGLQIDEENKCFTGKLDKKFIEANFESAKSTMWYDFKQQAPFKGFDLNAEIAKLIKKCETMSKKDGEEAELVNVDTAQLQALVKVVKA